MELRVLGCHGGETPRHRCPAFLVDSWLCLDAGAIARSLPIEQQARLEVVVVSHAHLDHVRDLALLADTRMQMGCPPLTIASTRGTIEVLRTHFFNNRLWPDFTCIPSPDAPTLLLQTLEPELETGFGSYRIRPILVNHSVEAAGFILTNGVTALAYSGDTGPTDRFWQALGEHPEVAAVIVEVSFPNSHQDIATRSGHHTPSSLQQDLRKLDHRQRDLPIMVFHIKPVFQRETEREIAQIGTHHLIVLNADDEFVL